MISEIINGIKKIAHMRSRWGTVMKICLQNWGKTKLGNAPLKRNMLFNLRGMDRYTNEVII